MNRRRRMLSSNLCCRFETVPHCEKKQTCKHEGMKKTKKAKVKIMCPTGFEPKTFEIRPYCYYQLTYVRI